MTKKLSVLAALMLSVLVTAYSVGGTYAKYTTTNTLSGTATVAKWAIAMKANDATITNTTTINLATAMKDTVDDGTEANVASGKIAPGTKGTFNFNVDGTGTEVDYTYTITLDNFSNVPTNFVLSAAEGTTVETTGSGDTLKYVITGTITHDATEKNIISALNWVWAYETLDTESSATAGDTADTTNGIAGAPMTFDVTITATQID